MSKARSLLQQPRVREAVDRVSSLAEQLHLRETLGRVPPLVRQWRLPERLGGFYDSSLKPHVERLGRPKRRDAIPDLDRLMARGTELEKAFGDDEQWRSQALAWLAEGEALLRERLPEEFYRLTSFAARLALYADQGRLHQAVSERLAVLADIRRRRGVHTPAG
jgi:hypothetical protein